MPLPRHGLAVLAALVLCLVTGTALASDQVSAKALESRLYAPCCYGGTLLVHDSELASQLRKEIESRTDHGESSEAIQADFVARYGEKILAAKSDRPSEVMGTLLVLLMLAGAGGLALLLRRWLATAKKASSSASKPAAAAPKPKDDLDRRIDAELADLDAE